MSERRNIQSSWSDLWNLANSSFVSVPMDRTSRWELTESATSSSLTCNIHESGCGKGWLLATSWTLFHGKKESDESWS